MPHKKAILTILGTFGILALCGQIVHSQQKAGASTVQVHVVITDLNDNSEILVLRADNVQVKLGKNSSAWST